MAAASTHGAQQFADRVERALLRYAEPRHGEAGIFV
jgi:hypothetical protein